MRVESRATVPDPLLPSPPRVSRAPALVVLATVLATFWPLLGADFVSWDDFQTVALNPRLNPATPAGVGHYWVHPHMDLYIPVTYTFWGLVAAVARTGVADPRGIVLNPAIFHAANVLLHAAAALVVYQILRRLTSAAWPAVAGSLLFALHPVQVEPVGWVSGGKDVLSGLLALVAAWQYLEHAHVRDQRAGRGPTAHYWIATAAFVLGMLAKPAVVAVPLAIAAIECFVSRRPVRRVALSRLPWVAVAVPVVLVAKLVQPTPETFEAPLWARPLIAADALAFYLGKLLWPARLAIDYGRSPEYVLATGQLYWTWMIPGVVAAIAWIYRRRLPWIATGCLVFVAFVLPVLGLVKFDFQRHSTVADHYLYAAMLGPALAAVFVLVRWGGRTPYAVAALLLVALGARSFVQTWVWQDSEALYANAVRVNPVSLAGNDGLGQLALSSNDVDTAIRHFAAAVRGHPHDAIANYNLGNALLMAGRPGEAIGPYRVALARRRDPFFYTNLVTALAKSGDLAEAVRVCEEGLDRWPDSPQLRRTLDVLRSVQRPPATQPAVSSDPR